MTGNRLNDVMMIPDGSGTTVHVVGLNSLQNKLLCRFLENETGLVCRECVSPEKVLPEVNAGADRPVLILMDFKNVYNSNPWMGLGVGARTDFPNCSLALINVPSNKGYEKRLAEAGVRGVFYEEDSLDKLHKGVLTILGGEYWFSRNAMMKWFLEPPAPPSDKATVLTRREREVLLKIAYGLTNDEIADHLNISSHTVKNHTYNIFSKIKVPNRLQAAMWAAYHLQA